MLQSHTTLPYLGYIRRSISAQNDHVYCPVDPGSIQGRASLAYILDKEIHTRYNTRERLIIIKFGNSVQMGYRRDVLRSLQS